MDATTLRAALLGFVNDATEITPYGDGFLAWVPMTYADDDAVSVAVEPFNSGWLVSDHGATVGHLYDADAAVGTPSFDEAWHQLARPGTGFVPGDDLPEGTIAAWCTDSDLPETMLRVASACLRAEALRYVGQKRTRVDFTSRVVTRVRNFAPDLGRASVHTSPRSAVIPLQHDRKRSVTALVTSPDWPEPIAIQALSGGSRENRERGADRAYATFGPAALSHDRKISVINGRREQWGGGLVDTLQDVSLVAFYDEPRSLERALREALQPV